VLPSDQPAVSRAPHAASARELVAAERRLHRVLRNRLNAAVEGLGLSYAQVEVMLLLNERPNMHASLIARELDATRQGIHRLVRQLELGGLVDVLPPDVGAKPITLTRRGRRRLTNALDAVDARAVTGLRRMSAEDRRRALETMEQCERALRPVPRGWWFD
jgi:DNA-binding MarR family transcriptional regulator